MSGEEPVSLSPEPRTKPAQNTAAATWHSPCTTVSELSRLARLATTPQNAAASFGTERRVRGLSEHPNDQTDVLAVSPELEGSDHRPEGVEAQSDTVEGHHIVGSSDGSNEMPCVRAIALAQAPSGSSMGRPVWLRARSWVELMWSAPAASSKPFESCRHGSAWPAG